VIEFLPPGADVAVLLVLLFLAGVAAGVINTFAGGGSFLTLPVLVALGLPMSVANGTSRVSVALQNVTSVATFHRQGVQEYRAALWLALPMSVCSVLGAWLATRMDDAVLQPLFGGLLVVWAIVLYFWPASFEVGEDETPKPMDVSSWIAACGIGLYGGFAQAGVGFPLLALLTGYMRHAPVRANAIKVFVVLVFTVLALPVFVQSGQVVWREGLVLAAGTMLGAWVGTRWQLVAGESLIRWFVLIAVGVSGAALVIDALT
jgi:uncharacterized membrane protein YfcA